MKIEERGRRKGGGDDEAERKRIWERRREV
jgi:hypothetical protein